MTANVYLLEADSAFGNVLIPDDMARVAAQEWRRPGSADTWVPPVGEQANNFVPTDCIFSYSTDWILLNRKARDALGPSLAPCGEFLPVTLSGYDYEWFNCLTVVDAADWNRAEGEDRRSNPHHRAFRNVRRYEFRPERLVDLPALFRLKRGGLDLICTDLLRDAVRQADLTGFAFEHLWSAETGGVRRPFIGIEGVVGEPGRQRAARDKQARRDMLAKLASS